MADRDGAPTGGVEAIIRGAVRGRMGVALNYTRDSKLFSTLRLWIHVSREHDVVLHAAALSYYTVLSVVPLLTLLLFVTTVLHWERVETLTTGFTGLYLLPSGEERVLGALRQMSMSGHHTAIGVLLSVWGSIRLFTSLDRSFAAIFQTGPVRPVRRVGTGLLALLTVGLAIVAAATLVTAIGITEHPESHYGPVLLVGALVIVFSPIYYILPNADLAPLDVLPGAIFAAVAWTTLSTVFGFYVALLGASIAGVVGSFLLLLSWFYFTSLAVLLGGVLNAVLLGET